MRSKAKVELPVSAYATLGVVLAAGRNRGTAPVLSEALRNWMLETGSASDDNREAASRISLDPGAVAAVVVRGRRRGRAVGIGKLLYAIEDDDAYLAKLARTLRVDPSAVAAALRFSVLLLSAVDEAASAEAEKPKSPRRK